MFTLLALTAVNSTIGLILIVCLVAAAIAFVPGIKETPVLRNILIGVAVVAFFFWLLAMFNVVDVIDRPRLYTSVVRGVFGV
jgi:high-affinity nickel permease